MRKPDTQHDGGNGLYEHDEVGAQREAASHECAQCPLHFSMQRLTRAAVSQLVYYADGEYAPRRNLLGELERWQRLHALIATRICPASRQALSTTDDIVAAQRMIPEAQFTALREMLERCAARQAGDACPLEGAPRLEPFSEW